MANITAKQVNELRKKTGAGMMDCKKALVEAEGDLDQAVDLLRKKGQKVAAKRSDRDATEGLVVAKTNDTASNGVLLVLNCETDFVAKNGDFVALADKIADIALENNPADLEALKALTFEGELSIEAKLIEQVGVIGEKLDLSGFNTISAERVVAYNHPGNGLATIVGLNKQDDKFNEIGRQVAMQAAAMAPIALDKDQVDQNTIDRELEIGKELAIQEGKPAAIADKIANGRLNKFFQENTLLNQTSIRDNKKSVRQILADEDKELTVVAFKRFSLS